MCSYTCRICVCTRYMFFWIIRNMVAWVMFWLYPVCHKSIVLFATVFVPKTALWFLLTCIDVATLFRLSSLLLSLLFNCCFWKLFIMCLHVCVWVSFFAWFDRHVLFKQIQACLLNRCKCFQFLRTVANELYTFFGIGVVFFVCCTVALQLVDPWDLKWNCCCKKLADYSLCFADLA